MRDLDYSRLAWLLFFLIVATIPLLGLTDFNTKGEPREAIVAYTMISSDNWILPTNNGGEMAYKPPMFHWCIAAVSTVVGEVNEWTSRFPSALACIVMLVWVYVYFAKRDDEETAMVATFVTFTTFEVHRAAFACRVDMVLTVFIVGAILAFASWSEKEKRGIPWLAILMMSCGTLTKGPVAIILPCGIAGLYLLIRGENIFKLIAQFIGIAVASLILPLCWYYAAYLQGGDKFLELVAEENIGRFLGKMSYASHENPWWYNVEMIALGSLPWLLILFFGLKKEYFKIQKNDAGWKVWFKGHFIALRDKISSMKSHDLWALLAAVIVFVFYCIPKSKRGVYLLPVYPFMCWFIAKYIIWKVTDNVKVIRAFGHLIAGLSVLTLLAYAILSFFDIPNVSNLFAKTNFVTKIGIVLPVIWAFKWWLDKKYRETKTVLFTVAGVVMLYFALDSCYQPSVLNAKSDLTSVEPIKKEVKDEHLTSCVEADMMHFFTLNFYFHDNIGVWKEGEEEAGYILMGSRESEKFISEHADYEFDLRYQSEKFSCDIRKQYIQLFRFQKKDSPVNSIE